MATAMPVATQSPWRHLPNAISLLRVVLVAPISWLLVQRGWQSALALVAVAGVSDGVDGYLARHYGWQSRIGGMLDAVADKLLLVSCFVILAWLGEVPWWLSLIVVGRDLLIATGALLWRMLIGPIYPHPSLLSKACTLLQIVYLLAVLLALAGMRMPSQEWIGMPVALLCIASGTDYTVRWSLRAWRSHHAP